MFDLQGVIASATGIPYSLRDKKQRRENSLGQRNPGSEEEKRFRQRAEEASFTDGEN